METMQNLVAERAKRCGIALDADAPRKIALYYDMLAKANRMMNLTRVPDDWGEAVDRNVLDSLAPLRVAGLFDGVKSLIDVGAGAGFPGMMLSIALPRVRVTLLDALDKRVRFLNRAIG